MPRSIAAERISPLRKTLVAAVALAPLCLALGMSPAQATDTVSGGVSTPIATATATNSAPDDISITGSVSISNPTATTTAVTQNSANLITNTGTISITGTETATTVLLQGGAGTTTGQTAFTNTGTITNSVNYSPSDSVNSDGIYEAPFAGTTTNTHIGILVDGAGTDVLTNAGTISIQGNNSYGIEIEAPVYGTVYNSGTISLTGDNGVAFRTIAGGTVNGSISFTGAVTATGQNTSAVSIGGAVTGGVQVYSSITATGYSTTTRPTSDSELANIEGSSTHTATPTDTEQSAAAMIVSGNVAGGILIGAPPVGTTTTTATTVDKDADGIADVDEGTGAVNAYGSAPALQIGASGVTTIIGNVGNASGATDSEDVPDPATANDYGLIVRGSINAFGTFDGVTSTALQIGAPDGTGTVDMTGGVRVVGSITAESYDANATAIQIAAGSTVAEIRNEGFIDSTVLHSTVVVPNITTTTGAVTAATAYGIVVDAGGSLATITNYGYISAASTGDNASATAIIDKSTGAVGGNTIINEGYITSALTAGVSGDALTGKTIAADYSANTTGVTLIQQANPSPIEIEVETTTTASGTTTTTGAATGVVSGSTVDTSTATTTTTTTAVTTTASGVTTTTVATTPTVPAIVGDVILGSGTNNVQLLAGSMTGALDLGSGNGTSLIIDNTSGVSGALTTYEGALTYEGTGGIISVNNGILVNTSPTTINLKTFTVGSAGVVYFAVDPAAGTATQFVVTGQATLAAGASLGIDALSAVGTPQTYTIVSAASLSNGTSDTVLLSEVPYLLNATATTNASAGTISVTVSDKTAAQLGMNQGESAAFAPIIASLGNDPAIQSELLGQYSKSSFLGVYDQLLPDYAGGVFQMASAASDAITRATSRTNDIENPAGTRGAWGQEFAFGIDRSAASTPGYRGDGFGFVGGLETGGAGLGAFGVTAAFAAGSISDPHSPGDNSQSISEGELGTYWQGQFGGFRADARLGAAYLNFSDRRELYEADSTGAITLDRQAKAGAQGWSATGHFGAAYQWDFGKIYMRPQGSADYFRLFEGGYTEHGGSAPGTTTGSSSDGFDLAVASRTGYQSSATIAMVTGTTLGSGFLFRPEIELGYRDVFSGTAGDTTAHFAAGGANFTLLPAQIAGGGPEARFGLKGDTDFYELDFQLGGEERNNYYEADVKFNVRILF
ncbi:MAG: autotransporter domain-containing protein [Caulobacteraceae bacterium]